MGTIREDVFLGTTEKYNHKLELLAKMAQPEMWTFPMYEYGFVDCI